MLDLSLLSCRAVPKPDERVNEGPNGPTISPMKQEHTSASIGSSSPQPALNIFFRYLAWGSPEVGTR